MTARACKTPAVLGTARRWRSALALALAVPPAAGAGGPRRACDRGPLPVTVSDEGETRVKDVFVVSAPVPGLMRASSSRPATRSWRRRRSWRASNRAIRRSSIARSAAEARAGVARPQRRARTPRPSAPRAGGTGLRRVPSCERYAALARSHTVSAERPRRGATARADGRGRARGGAGRAARCGSRRRGGARAAAHPGPGARRGADCDCVIVYSPVSGRVLRVLKESEGVVPSGTPLIEVGNPERLEVVVDLLSDRRRAGRAGPARLIEAWGGDRPLDGACGAWSPSASPRCRRSASRNSASTWSSTSPIPRERWARLGHGYRVEPRIVLWESADVLKVPLSALFRRGDKWAVFVERAGRAELREVEIGQGNGLQAEVRSGLEAGERVVMHPADRVAPGTRLAERNE